MKAYVWLDDLHRMETTSICLSLKLRRPDGPSRSEARVEFMAHYISPGMCVWVCVRGTMREECVLAPGRGRLACLQKNSSGKVEMKHSRLPGGSEIRRGYYSGRYQGEPSAFTEQRQMGGGHASEIWRHDTTIVPAHTLSEDLFLSLDDGRGVFIKLGSSKNSTSAAPSA